MRRHLLKLVALAGLAAGVLVGGGHAVAQVYPPYGGGADTTPTYNQPTYTAPPATNTPAPAPAPASGDVGISGSNGSYRFKPRSLKVEKGKRVKWSWSSDAPHNVTFRKLGKHSKTGSKGSFSLRFRKAGTFRYLCTVHDFTGKVVVK